jgi:hypothetical protein
LTKYLSIVSVLAHTDAEADTPLVHGTGNPWVKSALPVPLPVKTRTRGMGTGFFTGLYFRTLTQPVPVPVASNPRV